MPDSAAPITLHSPLEGWLGPLDAVPDPVFAGRTLGDGVALDPVGSVLHAPCEGEIVSVAPTGHSVTLQVADGAQLLIHLGIDTVAMGGQGFEPLVTPGQQIRTGQDLIRFDLDRIVQQASSAETPILLLEADGWQIRTTRGPGMVQVGDPVAMLVPQAASAAAADIRSDAPETARTVAVPLRNGIHARPAARLRQCAQQFDAVVRMEHEGRSASLRSPVAMLALGVVLRDRITLYARGPQASAALDALEVMIAGGMGELAAPGEAPPAPAPRTKPTAPMAREWPEDRVLRGVSAAPGLAAGPAVPFRPDEIEPPAGSGDPATEAALLDEALDILSRQIAGEQAGADRHAASILAAHLAMLEDDDLRSAAQQVIAEGASAGSGWRTAIRKQVEILQSSGNARLAERADDMRDLERRVIAQLAGVDGAAITVPAGGVLIARDLLPSQLLALDAATLGGIALAEGGPTSHVAILAAGMGVPMVVALGPLALDVAEGTFVVLDAASARLEAAPSPGRIATVQTEREAREARLQAAREARDPCHTADGRRIEIFANLGLPGDAALAMENGAEGSGLVRSEFLFADRPEAPGLAEQRAAYQAMADTLGGRPMIVRLLDIGGDKPAAFLPTIAEENPALGLRGIRTGLAHPELLDTQLEAILSVQPAGQCRIMVPMVASLAELAEVRRRTDAVAARLGLAERVAIGIMVETPAAAITADLLAAEADFLSVGTNDLTQYTLAMDRGNPAVAPMLDGLHPAVLRLIGETVCGAARHGRWTGVCGGLASDPLAVPLLVGLGITELSASPALVPEIKGLVMRLSMTECQALAKRATGECTSAAEVRAMAAAFVKEASA